MEIMMNLKETQVYYNMYTENILKQNFRIIMCYHYYQKTVNNILSLTGKQVNDSTEMQFFYMYQSGLKLQL